MRVQGDLESDLERPSITSKKSTRLSRIVSKSPRQITIIKERKTLLPEDQPKPYTYTYYIRNVSIKHYRVRLFCV